MTARDSDGAVVLGLRAGADDYLVKPVRKAVLLARIEAVLRRLRRVTGDAPTNSAGPVVAGPVTIDRERREVTVDGVQQPLTRTEFQIVTNLAARQGEAVSREELMLEMWARPSSADPGRWISSSGRSGPNSPDFRFERCAASVFGWTPGDG